MYVKYQVVIHSRMIDLLVGFAKNTAVVNHGPENEKEEEKLVQRLTG